MRQAMLPAIVVGAVPREKIAADGESPMAAAQLFPESAYAFHRVVRQHRRPENSPLGS
jgi:hypothetical protein